MWSSIVCVWSWKQSVLGLVCVWRARLVSCLYTNVYSAYCKISFAVGWYTIQELFRRLPHQRKLSESERHEAETMLSPKANKKMIQDKLVRETSKAVILKDLSNISTRMQSGNMRNDLEESINSLCVILKAICSGFGLCLTCETSVMPLYQCVQCILQDLICCWLVHYPGAL